MAKVLFSALVSDMRNKLNGSVFARNRGGAYLRTKVTPVNPQTAAQVAARSLLTSFAQSWRSLTEAQRTAWNAVVDQWSTTDVFGSAVNPSGSQLYVRLNINISLAGGTPLTTPPTPTGANAITLLEIDAAVTGPTFDVTFAPATVPADHAMFVESTSMQSPGINNANSKFRRIDTIAAAATSPADLSTEQIAKFGALVEGQKVFVRAKFINMLTGEVSQRLVNSAIVGA
jgi:hypothetical protein